MVTTRVSRLSAILLACSVAFPTLADWHIDEDRSTLHFMSTKNAQVTEVHTFDKFAGSLSSSGELTVEVDLSSVNTAIDIRNERMQKMLFNVAKFAEANFEASLPSAMIDIPVGSVVSGKVDGIMTLNGKAVPTSFSVMVSKLTEDALTVSTVAPTLIKAESFGLEEGINALQSIAGLTSITKTVPVTFSVTLTQ